MSARNVLHGPFELPPPPLSQASAMAHHARRAAKADILRAIGRGECDCPACDDAGHTIPLPTSDVSASVRDGGQRALQAGWSWVTPKVHGPTYIKKFGAIL